MKIKYTIKTLTSKLMLMMLASGLVLVANLDSKAQESSDTLEVDWWDGETVTVNALRDAIANDTDRPDGRVYKLQQGGYYWNTDRIENDGFHLRIVGEKAGVGAQENPPVIQMVETEDGEIDQRMITGLDDVTLKNLWITGSDDTGAETAYQPIQIDAANSNFVFENNIIENSNYAVIAFTAGGNSIHFRDNIYRNLVGTDQQWEGRAISIWADQEEVIIENNTFFNIGMTILQIEGGSSKYVRFNHNTIVGVGRSINTGNWWQEAYFTNNIIVNGFWHGEGVEDYTTEPPREDDYAGMFSIGDLPSQYGTDHGRKIVFSNTSTWRDPAFEAGYEEDTRPQPLFNETIKTEWFGQFDGMMFDNIYEDVNPEFTVYPDVVDDQLQNILDLRNNVVPGNEYYWDPGRSDQTTAVNWPLPEDFSYSNAELMDAGTDGLPLGDLRWFPEQKEDFLANRDQYVDEIESMVETIEIDFAGSVEVEDGQLEGDSEIIGYDYPLQMKLGEGPNITWTYNAPSDGTYTLTLHYMIDSDDGEKGQKLLINDNYVPETEEDHMFAGENGVWEEYDVDVELVEGENKIRIQNSWGWMV
ncbi:MAG: CBM35 domain-containing protein, partial [Balneolales bacterium]